MEKADYLHASAIRLTAASLTVESRRPWNRVSKCWKKISYQPRTGY